MFNSKLFEHSNGLEINRYRVSLVRYLQLILGFPRQAAILRGHFLFPRLTRHSLFICPLLGRGHEKLQLGSLLHSGLLQRRSASSRESDNRKQAGESLGARQQKLHRDCPGDWAQKEIQIAELGGAQNRRHCKALSQPGGSRGHFNFGYLGQQEYKADLSHAWWPVG